MEILLFSITDLLVGLALGALVGAGSFLAVVLNTFGLLMSSPTRKARRKQAPETEKNLLLPLPEQPTLARKIAKALLALSLVTLITVLAATILIDRCYFEPFMRWTAGQVGKWGDITVDFEGASGSLWKGELAFSNFSATRRNHEVNDFQVSAKAIEVRLTKQNLLRGRINFDLISIDTVRGHWEQKQQKANTARVQKKFFIKELLIHDVRLDYTNSVKDRPLTARINLEDMNIDLVFSDILWVNLLFTSKIKGTVNETAFEVFQEIHDTDTETRRNSIWLCEKMPLDLLAALFDRPPLNWFDRGRVNIKVQSSVFWKKPWKMDTLGLDMDWSLIFSDQHVRVPADTPAPTRLAATPLIAYINDRQELPINYSMHLSWIYCQTATSAELEQTMEHVNENGLRKAFWGLRD